MSFLTFSTFSVLTGLISGSEEISEYWVLSLGDNSGPTWVLDVFLTGNLLILRSGRAGS